MDVVAYSPWGQKESDSTEWLSMNTGLFIFQAQELLY